MSLTIMLGERQIAELEDEDRMPVGSWSRLVGVSRQTFECAAFRGFERDVSIAGRKTSGGKNTEVLYDVGSLPGYVKGFRDAKMGNGLYTQPWAQSVDVDAKGFKVTVPSGLIFRYQKGK